MDKGLPLVGRSLLSLGILAAGVVGFFLMGQEEVEKRPPPRNPPPSVVTISAKAHGDVIKFDVDGVVVPFREINLAAQVAGIVDFKSPNCRVGRVVTKGEVLLKIEERDYELEKDRLTEELAQAGTMIEELIAEIQSIDNQIKSTEEQQSIDKIVLDRNLRLFESKAASTVEVESARRTELATRIAMQSLEDQKNLLVKRQARMESAKKLVDAGLKKAILNLERVQVKSPIDGVVVSESVQEGGYVQTGSTMIVIQETSCMDVSCKIYMRQMQWLWRQAEDGEVGSAEQGEHDFPDTKAEVIYDLMGSRYVWNGVVDRYDGGGIDSQTRMVPCRVHVAEPTKVSVESESRLAAQNSAADSSGAFASGNEDPGPPTLLTGMFVKVRIHAKPNIKLVQIPHSSIQPGGRVWIVSEGKLREQVVELATSTPEYVIAFQQGALVEGAKVVTSPLASPEEAMEVLLVEEEGAGSAIKPGNVNGKRTQNQRRKSPAGEAGRQR